MKSTFAVVLTTLFVPVIVTEGKYNGPTNQAGLNLIKEFEGFYPKFYRDPVGIKTIGYGHACHVHNCRIPLNGKYNVPLTRATAEALLKEDLRTHENCVKNHVTYSNLNANQFSALTSFTFNLGCGSLKSSTLLQKLNSGDVTGASNEFKRWVRAGGKVLKGLVRRRAAEEKLFCDGSSCGSGDSGGSVTCTGKALAGLNIRASASASSKIVGYLANGGSTTITGRAAGTNVRGNNNWFKVPAGYVSAYYIRIVSSNGAWWCAK